MGEEDDPTSDVSRALVPGRWNWIVDAIDGTAAYIKGSNSFAIEIALVDEKSRPVLGMIHLPAWQRRFYVAWEGELFRWADGRLTLEGRSSLPAEWRDRADAPVARSYLYGNSDLHRRGLHTFGGKVRNLGGTAAHLALLADRTVDPIAVVVSRCEVWDVAGGLALAEAAGIEVRRGSDWSVVDPAEIIGSPQIKNMLPIVLGLPEALRVLEPELRGRLR
ncbi:MAG: inositol monophosphatase family protein [Bryobacterales bacterium]